MNRIWHEPGMTKRCHWFADPGPPLTGTPGLPGRRWQQAGWSPQLHPAGFTTAQGRFAGGWRGSETGELQGCSRARGTLPSHFGSRPPPSLGCLHPRLMLAVGTRPGGAVWHRGVWKHPWKKQPENSAALSVLRPSLYNSHLFAGLCVWREHWGIKG